MTEMKYKIKATAAGTFTVPAAYASSMYDQTIQAHTAADKFTVAPLNE